MGGDSEETRQSSVRSVLIGGKRLRDDSAGACGWAVTTSRVVAPNVNDIFVFLMCIARRKGVRHLVIESCKDESNDVRDGRRN